MWNEKIVIIALILPFLCFARGKNSLLDRQGEPFNYVSYPTDQMGIIYNPDGTEITPEGFLYTGYGELMFFAGDSLKPINQRIRTLEDGYLPIYHYQVERDGISYHFSAFASSLDEKLEENLLNFIRVTIKNMGAKQKKALFATAFRYTNADNSHRFRRPIKAKYPGAHSHSGVVFNPNWQYQFENNMLFRDDSLMLVFVNNSSRKISLHKQMHPKSKSKVLPDTPLGFVKYEVQLAPNESAKLDFIMPYRPFPRNAQEIKQILAKDFDQEKTKVAEIWKNLVQQGMSISLSEEKVVNTFNANLIYNLMALDKVGDDYIQTVNLFHYHAFWLRDGSFVARAYDLTGYHDIAEKCLDFFLRWQRDDGNFVSQGGQFDGWGQTLWAFGQHVEMTGDIDFARKVFPAVVKAVDWLKKARQEDPFHIMPKTRPGDNEQITGHVTGHNFWALLGLKKAIFLAKVLGEDEKRRDFEKEYIDFFAAFKKRLQTITEISGGYIPPGMDDLSGYDWGNLLSVFPEPILDPFDPMVTATQTSARNKFREGLMTYANQRYIHNYLTTNVTQTSLIRNEQRDVLHDFYSILVHTTSTHAGFEFSVFPWKDRDVHGNLTPHGWFAAKFRILLHDMLIRDQDEKVHLFSVISPDWIKNNEPITVKNAPSKFGKFDFELVPDDSGAIVKWQGDLRKQPETLVIHIPFFVTLKNIVFQGKEYPVRKSLGLAAPQLPRLSTDRIELPAESGKVRLNWTKNSPSDVFSYEYFVRKYQLEYDFQTK